MAINKVTYEQQPYLFDDIHCNFDTHTLEQPMSKGWISYKSLITFGPENAEHYKDVENFEQYYGTWESNEYEIYKEDPEFEEGETIHTLYRVEEKEVIIKKWVRAEN